MDIAEIRKKAKAQPEPEELELEATDLPDYELASEPLDVPDESTDVVASETTLASFEGGDGTAHETADGLDRLFAATEELALATDESYADMLEAQAASHGQANRQYLAFHLADEEYALDITQISEIIKVREFTDIPRAPEFVLGIISLRGVVVPVFDLRQRLNLGKSELIATSRVIVCQNDDVTVGFLVDTINQVVDLVDDEVEPPPGVLSGLDRDMVFGIGRYQGRMIILLNLH
jgi:purine-binding chemotaxis protein CheW